MGVIIFNGICSEDLGIKVAKPPEYQIPERDVSTTLVPGRNGDAILYVGAFNSVEREYEISFIADIPFAERAAAIARWLFSSSGYARLSDDYDPTVYRLAYCKRTPSIESLYQEAGRGSVTFVCRPERFLTSGESAVTFTASGSLLNPTGMAAMPILTVYGTEAGTVTIGNMTINVVGIPDGSLTIDCETENAYYGSTNRNGSISAQSGFPVLDAGETSISWTGDITKIEITPRWWSI